MIPDLIAPPGIAYEWHRFSLYGEVDEKNLAILAASTWQRVPRSRYPAIKSEHQDYVVVGGLILVERSKELQHAARVADQRNADAHYNDALANLERDLGVARGRLGRMNRTPFVGVKNWKTIEFLFSSDDLGPLRAGAPLSFKRGVPETVTVGEEDGFMAGCRWIDPDDGVSNKALAWIPIKRSASVRIYVAMKDD